MHAALATVGRRVRAARHASKLTQAQLASQINRSVSTVRNIEQDCYTPPLTLIDSIAAACGVSRLELIPDHTPALQGA